MTATLVDLSLFILPHFPGRRSALKFGKDPRQVPRRRRGAQNLGLAWRLDQPLVQRFYPTDFSAPRTHGWVASAWHAHPVISLRSRRFCAFRGAKLRRRDATVPVASGRDTDCPSTDLLESAAA